MKRIEDIKSKGGRRGKRFLRIISVLILFGIIAVMALYFTNYRSFGDYVDSKLFFDRPVTHEPKSIFQDTTVETLGKTDSGFFAFNTHYDHISLDTMNPDTSEYIDVVGTDSMEIETDTLGTSAILTDSLTEKDSSTAIYVNEIGNMEATPKPKVDDLTLDPSFRILAIASKNLILNKSRDDQESIILILCESASINTITIVDLEDRILFSTNQKYIGKKASDFIRYKIPTDIVTCGSNKTICVLPLFHTFGKLGYAIIQS